MWYYDFCALQVGKLRYGEVRKVPQWVGGGIGIWTWGVLTPPLCYVGSTWRMCSTKTRETNTKDPGNKIQHIGRAEGIPRWNMKGCSRIVAVQGGLECSWCRLQQRVGPDDLLSLIMLGVVSLLEKELIVSQESKKLGGNTQEKGYWLCFGQYLCRHYEVYPEYVFTENCDLWKEWGDKGVCVLFEASVQV